MINVNTNYQEILKHFSFTKIKFLSYEQLKKEVNKLKIKSIKEYTAYKKINWPNRPDGTYTNKGWISWGIFFEKEKKFLSLTRLKKEVKKFKIKSATQYKKNRKSNWPSNPNKTYQDTGWISWRDLLGEKFLSLNELKKEVKKLKIKSAKEYAKKRKTTWPSRPDEYYQNKKWKNWNDLFGK